MPALLTVARRKLGMALDFWRSCLVVTALDNVVAWYLSISTNILDAVAREPGRLLIAADTKRGKPDIDDRWCDDNHDDG